MEKMNSSVNDAHMISEPGHVHTFLRDGKSDPYPVSPKRQALLVGNETLFENGVNDLLHYRANMSVTHVQYQDDSSILRDVVRHRPDVVVLILSRAMNLEYIVGLLMSVQQISRLRLVLLSLDTIEIEIYERGEGTDDVKSTNIMAANVDDFLRAVNKNWSETSYSHLL